MTHLFVLFGSGKMDSIFFDEKKCIDYLYAHGVFYQSMECEKCKAMLFVDKIRLCFRCNFRSCRTQQSYRKGTFFFGSRLKCCVIMNLANLWINKATVSTSIGVTKLSSTTVSTFYRHFRTLVASTLEAKDDIIGGPNTIVEIDETKLGKRKYNRGHKVNGTWAVVGVERTRERNIFVIPVEKRDSHTLKEIIETHVAPGSLIHTDLWKGYEFLKDSENYSHRTVNHSLHFKDPDTGVHTNTVEGNNFAIKRAIPIRARTASNIKEHLMEFIWRRKNSGRNLWDIFIKALRDIHYEIE